MTEKTIEIEADTLKEARERLESQIPGGFQLISERITSSGKPQHVTTIADTVEEAFTSAQGHVPAGAFILEKKVRHEPLTKLVTIQAYDEETARELAIRQEYSEYPNMVQVKSLQLLVPGKKIFGVPIKPNQYQAEIFHQPVVEIIYHEKARIIAIISDTKLVDNVETGQAGAPVVIRLKCNFCGKRYTIGEDTVITSPIVPAEGALWGQTLPDTIASMDWKTLTGSPR